MTFLGLSIFLPNLTSRWQRKHFQILTLKSPQFLFLFQYLPKNKPDFYLKTNLKKNKPPWLKESDTKNHLNENHFNFFYSFFSTKHCCIILINNWSTITCVVALIWFIYNCLFPTCFCTVDEEKNLELKLYRKKAEQKQT